jgi:hypothetical protein
MNEERVRQIVRQFPENGMKQVLSSPANLRDLLALAKATLVSRIDFRGMQIDPTTYVTAEYRHVSSDLVLTVTLLPSAKHKRKKRLTLTILIELQQQPDRLMLLRVLDYVVQIWKQQVREYGDRHGSLASVKLRPVLPVVLHTGSYSWERLGSLLDLMDLDDDAQEQLRDTTPVFKPLFVSLPDLAQTQLESEGGYLGQVLALLRARSAKPAEFAQRLGQTVTKLQELTGSERLRRLELLCYVEGLVYHARQGSEHPLLRQRIDAALRNDETRLEVEMVRRTLADIHRDEARDEERLAERKRTLLEQLRLKFKSLPAETEQTIEATQDAEQLAEWLRRFATATRLKTIGIVAPR